MELVVRYMCNSWIKLPGHVKVADDTKSSVSSTDLACNNFQLNKKCLCDTLVPRILGLIKTVWNRRLVAVSYTHLDVYKRQVWGLWETVVPEGCKDGNC